MEFGVSFYFSASKVCSTGVLSTVVQPTGVLVVICVCSGSDQIRLTTLLFFARTPWGEVHLTKRSASRMCKFFWDDDGDDDRNPTLMDSYVCVYCLCLMCTSHNAVVPYCSLYVCCTIVHCTHNNSIHALYLRATIEEVNSVMYVNVCSVQTL